MEYDEFLTQVQTRARLGSRAEAERATRAVLETVAEQMTYEAAAKLATQLPTDIGDHLRRTAPRPMLPGPGQPMDTFFDRVTEREGVARSVAVFHTRVVLELTKEVAATRVVQRSHPAVDYSKLLKNGFGGRWF